MISNIIILIQIIACGTSWNMISEYLKGPSYSKQDEVSYSYVRCTRRFSPGACAEPLHPVWTFVFAAQNCTERLGCPVDPRANRFRTYSRCIRRCQSLVDLYTHILASDSNQTFYLRNDTQRNESRREGDEIFPPFNVENDAIFHSEDTEVKEIEIRSNDETEHISDNNDIFAPNLDDEDGDSDQIRVLEEDTMNI